MDVLSKTQAVILLTAVGLSYNATSFSSPDDVGLGVNLATSIPTHRFPVTSEPERISGYKIALQARHRDLTWEKFKPFLALSVAHWSAAHDDLSIIGLSPVLRYQWLDQSVTPFIDFSAGPAYLSQTTFVHNRLGIHYTFQDMLGFGVKIKKYNLAISWQITHYSNAGLSEYNRGITVPLMLSLDYQA